MSRLTQLLVLSVIFYPIVNADFWDVFDVECPLLEIEHGVVKIKQLWLSVEAHFWCDNNFVLIGEKVLACELGQWDNHPPTCVPKGIKPNSYQSCGSNNGGCQHICKPRGYCGCFEGFQLSDDRKSCFDIDECFSEHPPCQGNCLNTLGSFRCHCLPGTYVGPDGRSCLDINECESNNFNCSHFCANTMGGAFCVCPENLILGKDNKTCIISSVNTNGQDILQSIYEKIIVLEAKFNQQALQMEDIMQTLEKLQDHKTKILENDANILCGEDKSLDQVEKEVKRGVKLTEFLIHECSLSSKSQDINLSEQLSLLGNDTKGELHNLGTQLKNVSHLVEKLTTALHGPKIENLFPLHK